MPELNKIPELKITNTKDESRKTAIMGYYYYIKGVTSIKKQLQSKKVTKYKKSEIPFWKKSNLSIDEAAAYFGIGQKALKIRHFDDLPNGFTLRLHLLKVDYPMNDESTLRDAGCFFE